MKDRNDGTNNSTTTSTTQLQHQNANDGTNNNQPINSNDEGNIVSVIILRGTTDAVDKKPSNQIQKYKHEQLRCKKHSFSILNYRRDRRTKNRTTTNSRHLQIYY